MGDHAFRKMDEPLEEVTRKLKWMQERVTLHTDRAMLANDIA